MVRCTLNGTTYSNVGIVAMRGGLPIYVASLEHFPGASDYDRVASFTLVPAASTGGPDPQQLSVTFDYTGAGSPDAQPTVLFYWLPSECRFSHGDRPSGLDYTHSCS